jgi:hypothetical protein
MNDAMNLFFIAILPPDLPPAITASGVYCFLMCDGVRTACVAYVSSGMMKHGVRYIVNDRRACACRNCFDVSMGHTIIPSAYGSQRLERASTSRSGVQEMRQKVIGDVHGDGWP